MALPPSGIVPAMIPRRPAQLFRSRWSALWWAFTVIVGTIMTVGFGDPAPSNTTTAAPTDALGQPVNEADLQALASVLNSN